MQGDDTLSKVTGIIDASQLPWADQIHDWLKPSVRLLSVPHPGEIPVGTSRLGGLPDLPSDIPWPQSNQGSLRFLAQINLADVNKIVVGLPLPEIGLLSFFASNNEQNPFWSINYFEQIEQMEVRTTPSYGSAVQHYPACKVEMRLEWTLPRLDSPYLNQLGITWETMYDPAHKIEGAAEQGETYLTLIKTIQNLYSQGPNAVHRFWGHPDALQGDMQLECQLMKQHLFNDWQQGNLDQMELRSQMAIATTWNMLLQIDSDPYAHMVWGDVGKLFFWFRGEICKGEDHLVENNWAILQST